MRLAHFIQRYPPALGGSEAYFARLSRFCADRGDRVSVFTSDADALEAFWSPAAERLPTGVTDDAGVEVRRYRLWRMRGRRWLLKPLSLIPHRPWQCMTMPCNPIAWGMWHDANHEAIRFDAVHATAFPYAWPIVCAWRLARRLGVPFLLTPFLHLGDPAAPSDPTRRAYTAPALRWLLQQADTVFVQTPSEHNAVRLLGVPAANIVLQGLGVDPRECTGGDRAEARRRWNLPDDGAIVGHLANLSFEKGTNDLLAALEHSATHHLLLAGPQMPNFTRCWHDFRRRRPELAKRVTLLGRLTEIDKRDFYAAIDVFALPSRSDSFGLVLLEAWANGVPCLGYRAGGIADVIQHESDGLLVPCGQIDALGQALARLCADAGLRRQLGANGSGRLPREFDWDDKMTIVHEEYARVRRPRVLCPC